MPRQLPPLNALRAFEAAGRHLSLSKAASELNVTPAAISQQVRSLEEFLGTELFRRLARGLALTDAGHAYLPGLTEGLDRLARATDRVKGHGLGGVLRISVLPSFAFGWLIHRLQDFGKRYPEIDVEVISEIRHVDFMSEPVDCGIRYGTGSFTGLQCELIMTEEVFPVCSHLLLNGAPPLRRVKDLQQHTLIHDAGAKPHEYWLHWHSWLTDLGLSVANAARGPRFFDTTLIVEAAAAGQGVALGRSAVMETHLRDGRLVRPFGISRPSDNAYYFVAPSLTADHPKVVAFRDWLLHEAIKL